MYEVFGGFQAEMNIIRHIIIRMFVALTMCAVTTMIRLTSFLVIAGTKQIHAESVWILRIILASILSPILFGFLDRRTSTWAIRSKHQRQSSESSLNFSNHGH